MAANNLSDETAHEVSNVTRWYDNRCIFITGATGFMGKVLVEKLLSSCPGISKIYVLMRKKRDMLPEKRLEQMKQIPIFDYLRKYYPQRLDKLIAIPGDILEPELGISQENQRILFNNVTVIFHSAATVKFDEALRLSVTMNMLGTRWLLQLSQKMKSLEAFVHVSTAYCNCDVYDIEEKIYPPPGDVDKVLSSLKAFDDDMIDKMTFKLIGNRPNTYTFTKAMAENILAKEGAGMPIVIIRPSIVTAALQWPMPGWVDNLNGPTGIIAGAGKGILRTLYCERRNRGDLIPVDICINAMILAAWNVAKDTKRSSIKVYHVTTGADNPITWGQIENWCYTQIITHPFDDVLWYPGGSFKSKRILNSACFLLFHMVPAYIIDFSSSLFGKKTGGSLVKVQSKIKKAVLALEYFTIREWNFKSNNLHQLESLLSDVDRKLFYVNVKKIQWIPYWEEYVRGVRKYILKEDEQNIPKAKRHLQKMLIIHYATKTLVILAFMRLILGHSEIARKMGGGIIYYTLQLLRKFSQIALK